MSDDAPQVTSPAYESVSPAADPKPAADEHERADAFGENGPYSDAPGGPAEEPENAAGAEQWGALSDCFLTIFTQPRETIRRIVSINPRYWVVALAALSGTSITLSPMPGIREARTGLIFILGMSVTVAPLLSILFLWIGAWIVRELGHALLGGTATPEATRAALAWANVPKVATLPIGLIASVLMTQGVRLGGGVSFGVAIGLISLVSFAATIWGIYIASQTIAEVQGYQSGWRGFLNLLLPLLIFMVIGAFFAIVIPLAVR